MKKIIIILSILPVLLLPLITSSYSGGDHNSRTPSGAPAGHTGSPGDGKNCTVCHGGTATPVSGILSSDVPATGYIAGETYNFTVTLTGTGRKGFQASPQNVEGTLLGSLTAGTGSQLVGFNNKYITHSAAQNTATASWTYQWTAPAIPGTGDVTMYIAGVISQPNVRLSSLLLKENYSIGISDTPDFITGIYPNPGRDVLFIEINLPGNNVVKADIFTLSGQHTGITATENPGYGTNTIKINHSLQSGTYVLRLNTGAGDTFRKLMII
ncbi:MAG TPA: T9SS type A sorting domain-containing protein [Lentimicrobium sp.]|nr:T9SS type A sorting domain-containing protein [Lentimicrobium sp.]